MSIATVRAAVVVLLKQVAGVGVVNESIPAGKDPSHFAGHFIEPTSGKVNGWTVSVVEADPGQRIGTVEHRYTITVRGLLGIEMDQPDARPAAVAEALIGSLVAKFGQSIANRRLGSTVHYTDPPTFTLQVVQARMASGLKPCHLITMNLRAYFEEALVA